VKPPKFEYHAVASVEEAVSLLQRYGGDARPLAGGQSLVPMLNFRLASPRALVDLRLIPQIAGLREDGDSVLVGAMTRQRALEFSGVVQKRLPLVREALRWVGHLPTRGRGTIGGSLSHADPSAELPLAMTALDAEMVAHGPKGRRSIPASQFFTGYFSTALAADELLVEIRIPAAADGDGVAVEEFSRRQGDFAIAAIAAVVGKDGKKVRIAAGGVGPHATRLREAEAILEKGGMNDDTITAACTKASEVVQPGSDQNGSADYRRHIIGVLLERALRRAAGMA
jgi:carbon-monoxide dehydrogenase medium subunit